MAGETEHDVDAGLEGLPLQRRKDPNEIGLTDRALAAPVEV